MKRISVHLLFRVFRLLDYLFGDEEPFDWEEAEDWYNDYLDGDWPPEGR
jgi:hypothetical protein